MPRAEGGHLRRAFGSAGDREAGGTSESLVLRWAGLDVSWDSGLCQRRTSVALARQLF